MFIDINDYEQAINESFCLGSEKARQTLALIHEVKAMREKDPIKAKFHLEESERLRNDEEWNFIEYDNDVLEIIKKRNALEIKELKQ